MVDEDVRQCGQGAIAPVLLALPAPRKTKQPLRPQQKIQETKYSENHQKALQLPRPPNTILAPDRGQYKIGLAGRDGRLPKVKRMEFTKRASGSSLIEHCFRYIRSLVRSQINSSPLESTSRYEYLLCSLKFPLKWEIHNNIIMYITVSTPIMTCIVKYFLFIVFNKVYIIPFMEFPLKWKSLNNITIYITMSYEEILYNKKIYTTLFKGEVQ